MSVFTNKPFSRFWNGRARSDSQPYPGDFVGDAAPPFAELASGSDPIPTAEELERIRYYHSKMAIKDADFVDMDLNHERRRLICAGRLFRTNSTFERKGMYELFVLLFDNYLVITQVARTDSDVTFQVYKRPIPLDLLRVETFEALPSRKGSVNFGRRDGPTTFPPESWGIAPPSGDPREMLPLVICHDGRFGGTTRLFAESEDVQSTWKSKLEEAVLLRQKSSRMFEVNIVAREEFLKMGGGNSITYPPENRSGAGTINCATPFVTQDGRTLLAIGCAEGLWIGDGKDLGSFRWVLRLPVQQCAVIGDYGLLLILSDGDLHVWDLELCVPKSTGRTTTFRNKILETKGKPFLFRAGRLNGEMWIAAAIKKHVDTVFYIWEAVLTMGPDGPWPDPQEFPLIHNFFLPVECSEVIFLRTRLCVLYNNGFNLVSLPEISLVGVPQTGDRNVPECKKIVKQCSSGRPLSMTRIETEVFLLCYDRFGVYVDRYGVPLPDRSIVEWEGQADGVSFRFPYVLLFCVNFVEVRHLITGRLTQIIRADAAGGVGGSQTLRCLWDGRGGARSFDYDPDISGGGYHPGTSADGSGSSTELPTVLGAVDLAVPVAGDEWGAQSSSSVARQQCVFTLFAPIPPPYSLVEEPAEPYDANSII